MAHILTGNKFDPNKDIPGLSGKVYIITGGTAGIGFGITAHILQHNASKIILLSQKEEHADEAKAELEKYGDVSRVHWTQLDLKSLHQTDKVARSLLDSEPQIDGLILNAGEGVGLYNETEDGIDSHFQVNHLSQFHLAMILWPTLMKTLNSRLVLQSSEFHRMTPTHEFASLEEINKDIGPSNLYSRSKLAQVLFTRALVKRFRSNAPGFQGSNKSMGPWINAVHPGGVETDQQQQAIDAYGTKGKFGVKMVKPLLKDPVDEGCRPALFAACSEDVVKEGIQGEYIVPDRKITDVSKQAKDEEKGERLWTLSERLISERLGKPAYVQGG